MKYLKFCYHDLVGMFVNGTVYGELQLLSRGDRRRVRYLGGGGDHRI